MGNDRRKPARRTGGPRPAKPTRTPARKPGAGHKRQSGRQSESRPPQRSEQPRSSEEPRTFRLGVIPGATPGKWIDAWKNRMPHVGIEVVTIKVSAQRDALDELDAALVRPPLEHSDDLHVIPLYDEVPVVVAAADSFLMSADQLTADDLTGQVLIVPADNVLGPFSLPTQEPRFPQLSTTEDAIGTAASGTGIVVVPMSLARLYHRKDADYRPLAAGPVSTVALAWRRDATTPDVETFVGIVRGRTANSSR